MPPISLSPAFPSVPRPFGGVGFHVFDHTFAMEPEDRERHVARIWRELRPTFARLNYDWKWSPEEFDRCAEYLRRMQAEGTEVYLTNWAAPNVRGAELTAFAETIGDQLAELVFRRGGTNVRWFCVANELTLAGVGWGALVYDLPHFRELHAALHAAFAARQLPIGLVSTDASPIERWHSIEWAAQHMDDITAAYGGHHYMQEHGPRDPAFYPWLVRKLRQMGMGAPVVRSKGKPFLIGEFGSQPDFSTTDGVRNDRCLFFDTPEEPWVGLHVGEAVMAMVNTDAYGIGYWTFKDLPTKWRPHYINKWGILRWHGDDHSPRLFYDAVALLCRAFRGPAQVLDPGIAETWETPELRLAAIHAEGDEPGFSVALVNRAGAARSVTIQLPTGDDFPVRKYVFDPQRPAPHPEGRLPEAIAEFAAVGGAFTDEVAPDQLVIYTSRPWLRRGW